MSVQGFFVGVLCLLVMSSWIPFGDSFPKKKESWKVSHHFLNWKEKSFTVPGLDSAKINREIFRKAYGPRILKDWGYRLRLAVGNIPSWLFILPSGRQTADKAEQDQVLLRDEFVDEFETPQILKIYAQNLQGYLASIDKIRIRFTAPVVLLLVPSKIYANRISVSAEDILLEHRRTFEIKRNQVPLPAGTNQRRVEKEIRSKGYPLVSLLEEYKNLQKEDPTRLLYSPGDSHWSRWTVYQVGATLVRQLVQVMHLPSSCFQEQRSSAILRSQVGHWGDLLESLQLDSELPFARRFWSKDIADFARGVKQTNPPDSRCPDLVFAGTSYGEYWRNAGDISQSMLRHYRGIVRNESIPGKGPFGSIQALQPSKIKEGTILIWEFPFRSLKDAGSLGTSNFLP